MGCRTSPYSPDVVSWPRPDGTGVGVNAVPKRNAAIAITTNPVTITSRPEVLNQFGTGQSCRSGSTTNAINNAACAATKDHPVVVLLI